MSDLYSRRSKNEEDLRKLFFVTDKDLIRFHVADKVIEVFEANHIPYETYSDVKANPTIANVQNGVATFKNFRS